MIEKQIKVIYRNSLNLKHGRLIEHVSETVSGVCDLYQIEKPWNTVISPVGVSDEEFTGVCNNHKCFIYKDEKHFYRGGIRNVVTCAAWIE